LAAVVCVGTALVLEQDPGGWESASFHAVNELPGELYYPTWVVMQAGSIGAVAVATVVALAVRRMRLALDLLVAGTSAWLLATVVKAAVGRGRPDDLLQDVIIRGAPFAGEGYVSGHAAVAAALAAAATPYLPRRGQVGVWSVAFLVALARVYVGAHLPLDVLGGAAMGWAIGCLVHILLGEFGWRHDTPGDPARL
jgi:glycosyltransferase 2 family protein